MLLAPPAGASDSTTVDNLVAAARRRALIVEAARQFRVFASAAVILLIVVFLLGTDVLPGVLVAGAAAALAMAWAWRTWTAQKTPSEVAQIVDSRLALNDTISTAHFLLHSEATPRGPWAEIPLKQAAELAPRVETKRAFPLEGRRSWAVFGALAAAAATCFVARYAYTESLSIRPAFLTLTLQPIAERLQQTFVTKEIRPPEPQNAGRERKAADSVNGNPTQPENGERSSNKLPAPLTTKPSGQPGENARSDKSAGDNAGKQPPGQQSAATDGKAADENDRAQNASGSSSAQGPGNADTKETTAQSARNEGQASPGQMSGTPSLMSRMKDALSSMMAKLSPQTGGQKSPNAGDPSNQSGQKGEQAGKAGEQASSQQNSDGQDKSNSEETASGQGEGQTAEKAGGKQGQSSSSSQQKGADSQSGVGKQDGDKSLRDARQQEAMGKLAEILGKRSAELTGEMTVESPSGNQQLKTAYSQQKGKHRDSSSEINRNEVPERFEKYVRDYMEQVQRQPPKKR